MKRSKLVIRPAKGLPPHVQEQAISNIEQVVREVIANMPGIDVVVERKAIYTLPNLQWDDLDDADKGAIVRHLDDVSIWVKDHPGETMARSAKDYPIRFYDDEFLRELPRKKAAKFARRFHDEYVSLTAEECSQFQTAFERAASAFMREEEREVR